MKLYTITVTKFKCIYFVLCKYWNFHTQLVKVKTVIITLESNLKTSNKTGKCDIYI